jgi:hypothetical protein
MSKYLTYEYKGLKVTYTEDGRYYRIEDFSKILNEPVTVGGGASEFPQFSREYCEQMVDALIANKEKLNV